MAGKKSSHSMVIKPFVVLFKRFHLTIFFIFVIGCLAWAVILINEILTDDSGDTTYTSSINAGSIDQATLERVQALHTSSNPGAAPTLPSGRINPFGE